MKPRRVYVWTCPYCLRDFETENYMQRYCKPSHKQRAYELRRSQRGAPIVRVRRKKPVEADLP